MKDVIGYEDIFMVTQDGKVFSKRTKKFLIQGTTRTGYRVISSRIGGREGKAICIRVHRMVAEAFIPNPDNKPYVNHKDGNKLNNAVTNLEWVTGHENLQHAWDNGLRNSDTISCENNINSKLNETIIKYIRSSYIPRSKIFGARAMSRKFGVNKETVLDIIHNRTWKDI